MHFDIFSTIFKDKLDSTCLEIEFSISNTEFKNCFMGKMLENGKPLYWYGFPDMKSLKYDFYNFEDFTNAKIFNDKSLIEIWDDIEFLIIDGCEPEERLIFLIN